MPFRCGLAVVDEQVGHCGRAVVNTLGATVPYNTQILSLEIGFRPAILI
jgi:hypothetical protein